MIYCVSNKSFRTILYEKLCGLKFIQRVKSRKPSLNQITFNTQHVELDNLVKDNGLKGERIAKSAENVARLEVKDPNLFLKRKSLL